MADDWDTVITSSAPSNGNSSAWDSNQGLKVAAGRGRGLKVYDNDGAVGAQLAENMSSVKIDDDWGFGSSTNNNTSSKNNNDDWGTNNASSSFGESNGSKSFGSGQGGSRKCYKCNEDGHMSRDCPNAGTTNGGGGNRGCFKCGDTGHMSRECPKAGTGGGGGTGNRACFKCGQEGHMSRDCPNPSSGNSGGGNNRGCFKCGEEGHMSRDCPNPSSNAGGGGGNRACYKCGQEGHMSRECPNPSNGRENSDKPRGCFKCGDTDHISRDCTKSQTMDGPDGKPRENYIPQDEDSSMLFEGSIKSGVNFSDFDNIPLQVTGQGVPDYITSFESAGLRSLLLTNIKSSGYNKPTPVQKGSIPAILLRRDVIACAQTGSGKTAAYLVPVINILLEMGCTAGLFNQTQTPEAVVIAPTRELAIQIHKEAMKFSHNSILKTVIIYGGTNVQHQVSKVQSGCNILVATPGRLKDLVDRGYINFSAVKCFILDEADRMLDMGFGKDIEFIVNHPTMPPTGKRQTLMFSATFPEDVQKLAWNYLNDYIFVNTGVVGGTNPHVFQEFHEVSRPEKRNKLSETLKRIGDARTIIFVESKKTADFVAAFLCNTQFQATSIHGDRLQSQREEALRDFRRGTRNILVATNVAARGLDIAGVEYVINYDLPTDIEEYVHRIGRTGRVGNTGKSISFFDPEKDAPNASKLVQKLALSQAEVPAFLQAAASGMGYVYNSASNGQFNSRDMRRFGGESFVQSAPVEAEETWD